MTELTTIAELFRLDPLKCTRQNITDLVVFFRDRRKQFNLGNMTAGKTKAPSAKATEILKSVKVAELDL